MIVTNLYTKWCSTIDVDDPKEIFEKSSEYWRNILYERKLLIFKKINFSKDTYIKFGALFGNISREKMHGDGLGKSLPFHKFSNLSHKRLGEDFMPWHADIPNHKTHPFPIRTLWMVSNPNPDDGITGFLNVQDSIENLDEHLKNLISSVKVNQQDWFSLPGEKHVEKLNFQEFSLLKTHPVTGKYSLRLNHYNIPNVRTDGWIHSVKVNDVLQEDCSLIQSYIDAIESQKDMSYYHKWDLHDIIVYDNWSTVHCRTKLNLPTDSERVLLRININHKI